MLLACWTDDQNRIVRVDQSAAVKGQDWRKLLLSGVAPVGAASVRLVCGAQGGRAWFDECGLRRLRPYDPRLRVFVNQIVSGLLISWNLAEPDRLKNQAQVGSWINGFCGGELGAQMLQHLIVDRTA